MAVEPTREWSDEQLKSDAFPKKDIIQFIQDNATHSVRSPHKCRRFCTWNIWRRCVRIHPELQHAALLAKRSDMRQAALACERPGGGGGYTQGCGMTYSLHICGLKESRLRCETMSLSWAQHDNFPVRIASCLAVPQWAQVAGEPKKRRQNSEEGATDRCLQSAVWEQSK